MLRKGLLLICCTLFLCSFVAHANEWSLEFSTGYGVSESTQPDDGVSALFRFGIQRNFWLSDTENFGVQVAFQTGNYTSFNISQEVLDQVGGLPFYVSVKPFLSVLLSLHFEIFEDVDGYVKLGTAFRKATSQRLGSENIFSTVPEGQLGIAFNINNNAKIMVGYQLLFNGHYQYSFDETSAELSLSGLPSQHSVILGIHYHLGQ